MDGMNYSKGSIEMFLRNVPEIDYKNLTEFYGFAPPELRILDLRFRKKLTREEVAEELDISVPTIDRKINKILKRIDSYFDRFLTEYKLKI